VDGLGDVFVLMVNAHRSFRTLRHTGHGPLRLWEPEEAKRGMPRIAMSEIAGTRIQISTDDLDADAIARLAESLVAAPATP